MNKKNNFSGITLIALVITIIVLLILAGISIVGLTGENGIIKQAQTAKIDTERQGIEERINVMVADSIDRRNNVDKEKLKPKLQTLPEGKEIIDEEDTIYVIYPEYTFEIDVSTGDVIHSEVEVSDDKTPGNLDGEGTEEKPYKIESVEDLVAFFEESRKGEVHLGKNIILTRNLDIKSGRSYVNPNTTQFGDYNKDGITEGLMKELISINGKGLKFGYEFQGIFEGNGKEIRNIYSKIDNDGWRGFIGDLNAGTVKNLKLHGKINLNYEKPDFEHIRLGTFVGRNKSGVVENCISEVDINANLKEIKQINTKRSLYIAGVVGNNEGKTNNCINKGKINVSLSEKLDNKDLYTSITIGGVVGDSKGELVNCINYGNINVKKNKTGTVSNSKNLHIGGITGSASTTVKNVINLGNISGETEESIEVAGILGNSETDTSLIENVSNLGIISGIGKTKLSISGIVADGRGSFKNSYNIGKLNDNGSNTKYMGAIVGDTHTSTICENCIYLSSSAPYSAQSGDFAGVTKSDTLSISDVINYMNQNVNTNNQNSGNTQWKTWKLLGNQISF